MLYDFSTKTGLKKFGTSWFQIIVIPGLYSTFSIVMDNQTALFCLLWGMVANVYQRQYYMVKSIDIIIKENYFRLFKDLLFK